MSEQQSLWFSENFWRKTAIWVTALMALVLIILTFDSLAKISAGSDRVPGYDVINQRIYYRMNRARNMQEPVIGDAAPLFGQALSEEVRRNWSTSANSLCRPRTA